MSTAAWDKSVDFLVVGSGAAGMSGAIRARDLGLDVLIVEKGDTYGGSSAMSGGVCWVGNNPGMKARGIADSDEEVLTYLKAITKGEASEAHLKTYRDESKRMVDYFAEKTHLRFEPLEKYTDYYPEAPGGKPGGRSMEPETFDGSLLGEDFAQLHRPATSAMILGKFMITARLAQRMIMLNLSAMFLMAWLFFRYLLRSSKRKRCGGRDPELTNGNALIGRLRLSLKDRQVPLWLKSSLRELVTENGRVVGAIVEKDGGLLRIEARRGVLLAAGGFERNLAMRQKYGPAPASDEWTAGNDGNVGDGINAGVTAGGALSLMDEAWWTPVTQYPGTKSGWVLVVEKSLPGGIFINRNGERFTNEAAPYVDVVVEMYRNQKQTGNTVPGWMVFDATYRRNYIAGPVGPGKVMGDNTLSRRLRTQFLQKAATVEELAAKLQVPPDRLRKTLERFNAMAKAGKDTDYHRGESASDRYYGDDRVQPNPCLAPIEKGPFYAIPLYPGDLGTKGGLVTDTRARVLREDGSVIPGLYAAGNTSASIMARTYPGAGGTIGPALCFGFLSAEQAAAGDVQAAAPKLAATSA
jgi:3-oxosteroid 1-dehydrogenase